MNFNESEFSNLDLGISWIVFLISLINFELAFRAFALGGAFGLEVGRPGD